MAEYTYILTAGGPVTGSPLPPYFTFGDVAAFSLSSASGDLEAGDTLTVAIDSNMEFYDPLSATGDASIMAVAHATIPDGYDGSPVAVSVPLNTDVFRQRVNGLEKPLRVHVGFYRLRGEAYTLLGIVQGFASPVVAGPNAVSPVLPVTDYPTRVEAEALAERSENAAERAEEAAAGIVPPLQLDAPPTTSTVGSVGQLAVWHDSDNNKDHLYHLCYITEGESATLYHWEECVLVSMGNVAGGYPVLDGNGKIASAQLPPMDYIPTSEKGAANGVAGLDGNALVSPSNLPIGSDTSNGTFKVFRNNGIDVVSSTKRLRIIRALQNDIDARTNQYNPIVPVGLDYAVRSVCKNITEIPAATSDYSLVDSSATTNDHSHVYSHAPATAPTYRLPQVTNTTIAHYIELTVDFTNVQTYSFLDHAGEPIVPLFTPAIAAGDVYTFKCEYSAVKGSWLIYPQKQGAVADDFVMRGEVGAANGVAGLDADAKVPSANLPAGRVNVLGAVKLRLDRAYGLRIANGGYIEIAEASANEIAGRRSYTLIDTQNLNTAVTAAITDSNHIALTDAQKATAQEVFGVGGPITAIPAATSQYTLSYGRFSHVPELASVYVLPAVTDGSIANDIVLSVKFSSTVLTYEFQDSAGNTLVPLPLNGDIEAGSVVTFLCRYNPLLSQWVIYPVMDGKEAQE